MSKPIVVVTGSVQAEIVPALKPFFEIHQWTKMGVMPDEILKQEIACADGLVIAWKSHLNKEAIQLGKKLKVIAQHFVGYENIDITACTQQGIPFCNTASASVNTVAELAIALMFSLARHIDQCSQYVKRGEWGEKHKYDYLWGTEIYGSTLGVLGMGRIGSAVAQKAQGLGMHVLYHNRHRKIELENDMLQYAALDEVYQHADFIINTLPATKETHHMITFNAFQKMKRSAFFINVGRGDTVLTSDLIKALDMKVIQGAAIDVAENEPICITDNILKTPNLLITPHIGSETWGTHIRKSDITVKNIYNGIFGGSLIDCVNPEVLKDRNELI